jgi:hypothetical protein
METKTRYCEFRDNHADRLAVALMRSTCPRHPVNCDYYKIKALCPSCESYVKERCELNTGMHCSYCEHAGRVRDYWTVIGSI